MQTGTALRKRSTRTERKRVENPGADAKDGSAAHRRGTAHLEDVRRATATAVACGHNRSARTKADCALFNRDGSRDRAQGCATHQSRHPLDWRSSYAD